MVGYFLSLVLFLYRLMIDEFKFTQRHDVSRVCTRAFSTFFLAHVWPIFLACIYDNHDTDGNKDSSFAEVLLVLTGVMCMSCQNINICRLGKLKSLLNILTTRV